MLSRYNDQSEIPVYHVQFDAAAVGILGSFGTLLCRRLSVLVRVLEDYIAVLVDDDIRLASGLSHKAKGSEPVGVGLGRERYRIRALEVTPEHALVGGVHAQLLVKE